MEANNKILNAVKYIGGALLVLGSMLFIYGIVDSGFNILAAIGIGTIMGAVFIFLMGVFFVATEEALEKMKEKVW